LVSGTRATGFRDRRDRGRRSAALPRERMRLVARGCDSANGDRPCGGCGAAVRLNGALRRGNTLPAPLWGPAGMAIHQRCAARSRDARSVTSGPAQCLFRCAGDTEVRKMRVRRNLCRSRSQERAEIGIVRAITRRTDGVPGSGGAGSGETAGGKPPRLEPRTRSSPFDGVVNDTRAHVPRSDGRRARPPLPRAPSRADRRRRCGFVGANRRPDRRLGPDANGSTFRDGLI
jgi:hypothetical protein